MACIKTQVHNTNEAPWCKTLGGMPHGVEIKCYSMIILNESYIGTVQTGM